MKTCIRAWQHVFEFLLKWEMFQTEVTEKIKIHILCSVSSPRKSCCLWQCGKTQNALLRNSGYANVPQCYVIHTYMAYVVFFISCLFFCIILLWRLIVRIQMRCCKRCNISLTLDTFRVVCDVTVWLFYSSICHHLWLTWPWLNVKSFAKRYMFWISVLRLRFQNTHCVNLSRLLLWMCSHFNRAGSLWVPLAEYTVPKTVTNSVIVGHTVMFSKCVKTFECYKSISWELYGVHMNTAN